MRLPLRRLAAAPVWLVVLAAAWMSTTPHTDAAAPGELDGDLPGTGAALVVWGGGTPAELVTVAEDRGCVVRSVWIAMDGGLLVYVDGAPAAVNEAMLGHFSGGSLPAGIAAVVLCTGATQVSASSGPASSAPLIAPAPLGASPSIEQQFASAAFGGINHARDANGLEPLNFNPQLQRAAEQYVQLLLAQGGRLDHALDGMPWDRAQRAGYPSSIVGEVIASTANSEPLDVSGDSGVLIDAWLNSPPHRDILMGKDFAFTDLGVGCAVGHDGGGLNLVICVGMTGQP